MAVQAIKRAFWSFIGICTLGVLGGCGGTMDARPPKWSYISPAIIQPSCATASCHSTIADRAGVVLDDTKASRSLLLTRNFVIPGDPATSEMVTLMRAVGSRRMPPDFALPEADIQLVERWIVAGAMDN